MKKRTHVLSRLKTFDELMKGRRPGKPAILKGMNPAAMTPMALEMQKAVDENRLDATKCYLYAPSSWV